MRGGATTVRQPLPARRFPQRTCVACRTERQKRDLLRLVRTPQGTVAFDPTGRAPGRGAYLCADGSCWAQAVKRKSIERALSVALPIEIRDALEHGRLTSLGVSRDAGGGLHGAQ